MDSKVKIAAGVGAVGLVAIVVVRRRAAASAQASQSTSSGDTQSLGVYTPVSTGVSTGGAYAAPVDTSGGAADIGNPSSTAMQAGGQPGGAASVSDFAGLLQGVLSSGKSFALQAQGNAAANNSAAVSAINNAAPPASTSSQSSGAPAWNGSLSQIVGGRFMPNTTLYATDAGYRNAWDRSAAWNQNAAGANWNVVGQGVNQADLDKEIKNVLPW